MNILLQGLRTLRAPWSTFKKYNISYLPNWNIIFSTTDSSIEYILAAGWVSSTEQQPNDSHTQTQFPRIFYEKSSYEPSPFALRGTNLLPSFFTFSTFVFFQLEEGVMVVSVWKKIMLIFWLDGPSWIFLHLYFRDRKKKIQFFLYYKVISANRITARADLNKPIFFQFRPFYPKLWWRQSQSQNLVNSNMYSNRVRGLAAVYGQPKNPS